MTTFSNLFGFILESVGAESFVDRDWQVFGCFMNKNGIKVSFQIAVYNSRESATFAVRKRFDEITSQISARPKIILAWRTLLMVKRLTGEYVHGTMLLRFQVVLPRIKFVDKISLLDLIGRRLLERLMDDMRTVFRICINHFEHILTVPIHTDLGCEAIVEVIGVNSRVQMHHLDVEAAGGLHVHLHP